jgi:hypothetical protein
MRNAEVYVPYLQHFLLADGVDHVRISGLRLEHSTWLHPDVQDIRNYCGCLFGSATDDRLCC